MQKDLGYHCNTSTLSLAVMQACTIRAYLSKEKPTTMNSETNNGLITGEIP